MGDTIVIETPVATVLEVSGLQGPQGPPTTNASLLTSGTLADARLSAAVTTSLGKADTASQPGHTHAVSDVTGLQTALDGKQASGSYAAASHTHTPSEVGLGNVSNTAQVTSVTGTAPIVSSGGTTPAISIQNSPTLTGDVIINGASTGVSGSLKVGSTTGSFNRDVEIGGNGIVLRNIGGSGTTTIALGQGSISSYTLTPPAASGTIALTSNTVSSVAASASDVLGVSGANITGVDANATRLVYWNNTSNKLAYGTPSDAGAVASDPTGVSGADAIINIMSLTQAEYNAIGSPNAATLYLITDP